MGKLEKHAIAPDDKSDDGSVEIGLIAFIFAIVILIGLSTLYEMQRRAEREATKDQPAPVTSPATATAARSGEPGLLPHLLPATTRRS